MALADKPPIPFRVPPGIKLIRVDANTGMRAGPGDPKVILEAFKPGTAPPDNYSVIGADTANGAPTSQAAPDARQCGAHRDRRALLSVVARQVRVAALAVRQQPITSRAGAIIMRAEITAIVEDIKQSIGLLRRHL